MTPCLSLFLSLPLCIFCLSFSLHPRIFLALVPRATWLLGFTQRKKKYINVNIFYICSLVYVHIVMHLVFAFIFHSTWFASEQQHNNTASSLQRLTFDLCQCVRNLPCDTAASDSSNLGEMAGQNRLRTMPIWGTHFSANIPFSWKPYCFSCKPYLALITFLWGGYYEDNRD